MKIFLWEILVPAENSGKEIPVAYHQEWDKKVRELAGGLSILKPLKGHWVSDQKGLFTEKMIPVRIACSIHVIHDIAKFTLEHYKQKVVMLYKISDMVFYTKPGMTSLEYFPIKG